MRKDKNLMNRRPSRIPFTRTAFVRAISAPGLMVALSVPAPASLAQSEPAPAAQVSSGIEEVVVTARKRQESSQDAPLAVTAISAEQIERYDLSNLERVAASTPNFSVGRASNGSGAQLTLRGIGSSSTSIGIEQSVAVIVDGVYYGQGRVINEGFFDLASIEVLKGPQALFFGKNATAGAISLTSKDPGYSTEGHVRASYEFESEKPMLEAVGSFPLSDTLGLRLAVRGSAMQGGLFDNEADSYDQYSFDVATGNLYTLTAPRAPDKSPAEKELLGRATLKWTPSDELTATFKASGTLNSVNNPSWNYVAYRCPTGSSALTPNATCGDHFTIYQNNLPQELRDSLPEGKDQLYNDYASGQGTATVAYEALTWTLTSVTNYQYNENQWMLDADFQAGPTSNTYATEDSSWDAFSQELRLLTDFDSPVNFMIGGLYQNTKRDFQQWVATAGVENSAAADPADRYVAFEKLSSTDGETMSGFGQLIWTLSPTVEFNAGARYTHETKDSWYIHPYVNPAFLVAFQQDTKLTAEQTFVNWSPEATLTWKPTNEITVYGAYKTGYKSGGFSNSGIYGALTTVDDFAFDPEKAKGGELGLKTLLADNQVKFNVGVYYYEYEDLQVDFFNSPTFAFITTNAGNARTQGIEIETEWAPNATPGLRLRGSVNYNDAEFKDFIAPCWAGQTPGEGCTLTGPAPALTPQQDLSGTETAMAPTWTGTLGVTWEKGLASGALFSLSMDARYSGDYLASSFGNPWSHQSSYTVLDAQLGLTSPSGLWQASVIGKNLTNEFFITGTVDGPSTGGGTATDAGVPADQLGFAAMPRTIALQVTRYF